MLRLLVEDHAAAGEPTDRAACGQADRDLIRHAEPVGGGPETAAVEMHGRREQRGLCRRDGDAAERPRGPHRARHRDRVITGVERERKCRVNAGIDPAGQLDRAAAPIAIGSRGLDRHGARERRVAGDGEDRIVCRVDARQGGGVAEPLAARRADRHGCRCAAGVGREAGKRPHRADGPDELGLRR